MSDVFSNRKIKSDKVYYIVQKINMLVESYAKKAKLTDYTGEGKFYVSINTHTTQLASMGTTQELILKRIDMLAVFKSTDRYHVYNNSPESFKSLSLSQVVDIFTVAFYPEYIRIESFMNRLLFDNSENFSRNDFEEINILYKHVQNTQEFPTADEQIHKNI